MHYWLSICILKGIIKNGCFLNKPEPIFFSVNQFLIEKQLSHIFFKFFVGKDSDENVKPTRKKSVVDKKKWLHS